MSTEREVLRFKVAFQGEAGAYSEQAARRLFPSAQNVPMPSVKRVFESVEIGAADYAVVPLENSHAGSINETYDLLVRHGVQIVVETAVRISHCLLAPAGLGVDQIKKIYSHPQALEQCDEFLDSLDVERVSVHDTAGAARAVAERGEPGAAAIASREAAELYKLDVVAADIEDRPDNSTKFVGISRTASELFGPAVKTSVVFATLDAPGSLYRALGVFADRRVNLSKLESRPSGAKAWQYHFYLDFDLPQQDPQAQEVLAGLGAHTSFLRVLGSYAKA